MDQSSQSLDERVAAFTSDQLRQLQMSATANAKTIATANAPPQNSGVQQNRPSRSTGKIRIGANRSLSLSIC